MMIKEQINKVVPVLIVIVSIVSVTWIIAQKMADPTLVTTKYGKISQADYYQKIKTMPEAKNILRQATLDQILAAKYGDKVTNTMVKGSYQTSRAMYSVSDWSKALKQSGYTPDTYKAQIKKNLIAREAIKANVKITKADLQQQFKQYYPNVTVADIMVGNKVTALKVIQELKAGKSFEKILATQSLDTTTNGNQGIMPAFNSTSINVDPAIKKVAFTLANNQISPEPIKGSNGYYVIKMLKNPGKGSVAKYKDILTTQIINDYMAGTNGRSALSIYQRLYKQSNVDVRDKTLAAVGKFAQ
ncbi:peptidylprolyl isomerase [Periweissella cryptocerci]|uniref:peptidylprolyl isomerase n=1 Tax=Periweissella cryptocerci TaxID=2506420 RepID=A0A4P6YS78_9LACO|nr:peptidyl-prolyl cis-trans isomerase [Periweissella cryptocerci]QBO35538.1 peptidylprolyl isomerase [Periweissella cryptocerci]